MSPEPDVPNVWLTMVQNSILQLSTDETTSLAGTVAFYRVPNQRQVL